jgi:Fe2+ or Zn2+ uptake regulation protein
VRDQGKTSSEQLSERLVARGLRPTVQREHVYRVLLQDRDHPTAEQVFMRAKKGMPDISMATVYNCLDALVKCGLVKEVNVDRTARRYCPNMQEHWHFRCDTCGAVYDIDLAAAGPRPEVRVPKGFQPTTYEISVRGACPHCAKTNQN